jgi:hypothetical protein
LVVTVARAEGVANVEDGAATTHKRAHRTGTNRAIKSSMTIAILSAGYADRFGRPVLENTPRSFPARPP